MPGVPFKSKPSAAAAQGGAQEHPAISAFLSPKSRIFAGGHAAVNAKQLTPDEVAQKIASLLKPGPPFFSKVSNADLLDFISDQSIMNCDLLQAQAVANREARARHIALSANAAAAEEEVWDGVGTVWSALDALPAGASWARIPGQPATLTSSDDVDDDGLWSSLTLSVDVSCTKVSVGKSVVVPSKVLEQNHFFRGNPQALLSTIGAGSQYKWDDLRKHKTKSASTGSGSASGSGSAGAVSQLNYLSLSAYTDPQFTEMWKWPSWVPFFGEKEDKKHQVAKPADPATPTGKKRVWIPSTTDVSLHASWWGYSIYLPKSVIAGLEDDVEEAEKIANLINKCLTYVLNNIPSGLPTALGAIITILKAIAPTTGYISTFIGWSWDTIKSFDKGHGVVLSATWILPVALIPRSWDAPDASQPPADGAEQPANPTPTPAPAPAPAPAPTEPPATEQPAPTPTPTPAPAPAPEPTPAPTEPAAPTTPTDGTVPAPVDPVPTDGLVPSPLARTRQNFAAAATSPVPAAPTSSDPEDTPIVRPAKPTPAPGATLPPADPAKDNGGLDFSTPNESDTSNGAYPGDKYGRGGEASPPPAMGDSQPPAGQVPNDAES